MTPQAALDLGTTHGEEGGCMERRLAKMDGCGEFKAAHCSGRKGAGYC